MTTAVRRPSAQPASLDGFEDQVRAALEACHDPDRLGVSSPLAQPFFLGARCPTGLNAGSAQRGDALVRALRDAAAGLAPGDRTVLDAYAFRREHVFSKRTRRLQPRINNTAVASRLNLSERSFYRERDDVVRRLARKLIELARPSLGGERPSVTWMAGRSAAGAFLLEALDARRSVSLIGNSGVGKTTLAANVLHNLRGHRAFWYTLRVGASDTPSAILFALAHFLAEQGASATWQQIIADQGAAKLDRALATLRYDLAALATAGAAPVFCIDDVDLLQPDLVAHTQVKRVLEELAALQPVLLIGQRQVVVTAERLDLAGFSRAEFDQWADGAGLGGLAAATLSGIYGLSSGNPGLLSLFRAMHRSGVDILTFLRSDQALPSADVMFDRVCSRLDADAAALLFVLAVCHSPLSAEALTAKPEIVRLLEERELLRRGEYGALDVSPFVRRIAASRAPHMLPEGTHARLAAAFESFGRVVPCMHHWIEAGRPDRAVWLWHEHADQEIDFGQAAPALALMTRIAAETLDDPRDRAVLLHARGRLELLFGRHEAAEADLGRIAGAAPDAIRASARVLLGMSARTQGRDREALEHYRAAIDLADTAVLRSRVKARFAMGYVLHARESDLDAARRQARLALCDAHVLNADVAAQLGRFDEARAHYETALASIEGDPAGVLETSQALSGLGSLLWQMGDVAGATTAIERAIVIDRRRGAVWPEANDLNTLCAVHITAGRYAEALVVAEPALRIAASLGDAWLTSVLWANMAEAHLGLEHLDMAEELIRLSLAAEQVFIRPLALTLLGTLRARQGRLAEAESVLRDAIGCASDTERPYQEAVALTELAAVLQRLGRADEARSSQRTAVARFESMHLAAEADKAERRMHDLSIGA